MKSDLIQVDGKFYKKCKVIQLLTSDKTYLGLQPNGVWKYLYIKDINELGIGTFHHLYILSDEEIKERDWCLHIPTNTLYQCKNVVHDNKVKEETGNCKKIIATTDKSLLVIGSKNTELLSYTNKDGNFCLARPSNEFLQAYCKANGKIDEVLVEYELYSVTTTLNYKNVVDKKYSLKISPDNTITIKKVEEKMYSKEEIIELINNYRNLAKNSNLSIEMLNKWIEGNL